MEKKYTFKIYPAGLGRDVYRYIEMGGSCSLDQLSDAILDAFEFYEVEHMYEFCMGDRLDDVLSYQSYPQGRDDLPTSVLIDALHLEEKQKFIFHFDFGADWIFKLTVKKIENVEGTVQARVTKEKGRVLQYPYG